MDKIAIIVINILISEHYYPGLLLADPTGKGETIITDRVRSTTGRLCFDSCLSICLSTPGGGGGYPGQVQAEGVLQPGPGGYPDRGYPTLGTPQSDLAREYPDGGVPHLRYPHPPLVRPARGDTQTGEVP